MFLPRKRIILVTFIFYAVFIFSDGFSKTDLSRFSPGASAVGLGHSGVVGMNDPTWLYWNPAGLAHLKSQYATFSMHKVYQLNYLAYSHYVPFIGTFAGGMAHSFPGEAELISAGWGQKIWRDISLGFSTSLVRSETDKGQFGIGVLYQPSRQSIAWSGLSDIIGNRLTLSFAPQSLPFRKAWQVRTGILYEIIPQRVKMTWAHHSEPNQGTSHLGLVLCPDAQTEIFAGFQKYTFSDLSLGVGWRWENLNLTCTYNNTREKIVISAAVLIGGSAAERAERQYNQALNDIQHNKKKSARRHVHKALTFNPAHEKASILLNILESIIDKESQKIDSLVQRAEHYQKRGWYVSAATEYHEILKIDPYNEEAQEALAMLRPKVNTSTKRWFILGTKALKAAKLKQAKKIFETILLVRPEHKQSKQYVEKIKEYYNNKAEQLYYKALGFYKQGQRDRAHAHFKDVIEIIPDHAEAQEYITKIEKEQQQEKERIDFLLNRIDIAESEGRLVFALQTCQEILDIDPDNETALTRAEEINQRLNQYIQYHMRRGRVAFESQDYAQAQRAFETVLTLNPQHNGAHVYLRRISETTSSQTSTLIDSVYQLIKRREWNDAYVLLDSLERINPGFAESDSLREYLDRKIDANKKLTIARNHMLDEEYAQAMSILNQIVEKNPNYENAFLLRTRCQQQMDRYAENYYNRGIRHYTEENYQKAINAWNKVLEVNPNHKGAIEYIRRARERLEALERLPHDEKVR